MTFVYAYNTKEERKSLWDYLLQVNGTIKEAWLVLGDFNSVLHKEDRIGGNPVTWVEVEDFAHCIEECGLVQLPY